MPSHLFDLAFTTFRIQFTYLAKWFFGHQKRSGKFMRFLFLFRIAKTEENCVLVIVGFLPSIRIDEITHMKK